MLKPGAGRRSAAIRIPVHRFAFNIGPIEIHQSLAGCVADVGAKRFLQLEIDRHELVEAEITGGVLVDGIIDIGTGARFVAHAMP